MHIWFDPQKIKTDAWLLSRHPCSKQHQQVSPFACHQNAIFNKLNPISKYKSTFSKTYSKSFNSNVFIILQHQQYFPEKHFKLVEERQHRCHDPSKVLIDACLYRKWKKLEFFVCLLIWGAYMFGEPRKPFSEIRPK